MYRPPHTSQHFVDGQAKKRKVLDLSNTSTEDSDEAEYMQPSKIKEPKQVNKKKIVLVLHQRKAVIKTKQ